MTDPTSGDTPSDDTSQKATTGETTEPAEKPAAA